eukprot:TRINITY_DN502_c1_g1_i5.p1 TRINITY_DN502_c1_g1~~TRINITY_DN502_c1_g1_i5.p1  ORF type:complete len:150 (+),score=2.64 TRINITY_DN502_c1_g1_i5:96-545(+)
MQIIKKNVKIREICSNILCSKDKKMQLQEFLKYEQIRVLLCENTSIRQPCIVHVLYALCWWQYGNFLQNQKKEQKQQRKQKNKIKNEVKMKQHKEQGQEHEKKKWGGGEGKEKFLLVNIPTKFLGFFCGIRNIIIIIFINYQYKFQYFT